jgi:hypothetical protein
MVRLQPTPVASGRSTPRKALANTPVVCARHYRDWRAAEHLFSVRLAAPLYFAAYLL